MVTSPRLADTLDNGIKSSALHSFEDCSHAPLHENAGACNAKTQAFLKSQSG